LSSGLLASSEEEEESRGLPHQWRRVLDCILDFGRRKLVMFARPRAKVNPEGMRSLMLLLVDGISGCQKERFRVQRKVLDGL